MIYRADDSTETALLKVHHDIQGWWQHRDCTAQGPPWHTGLMTAQRLHCSRSTMIYRADHSTETALLKVNHDIQGCWQHRDCSAQGPPWYTGLMTAQQRHCSKSTLIYRADHSTETALLKVHHDIQGWWQRRDCTAQGPPWYTGLMRAQRLHCSRSTMIYRADHSTETALLKVHHDIQGWSQHRDCTAQGPPWYTGLMTAQRLHCSRSTMKYRADESTATALLKVHHDIQGWWQHRDCTAQGPPWYTGLMTAQKLHCSRSTMIYRADDSTETALLKVHHDIQGWSQHRDYTAQGPPWYTGLITAQRLHCSRSTMIYRADDSTATALLKVHHDIHGWSQHRDCTAQGPPWYTGLMTAQRLHCSRSTMIYRADDSTETALLKVHHDIQGWWEHSDCTAQGPPWYTGLITAQRRHCSRSTMINRADHSTETALLKVHHDIQGWWQHRDCTAQGPPWNTGLMRAQGWWEHSDCTAQGPPWYTGLMTAQRRHCSRSTMIYRADHSTETALLKVHHDIHGWSQHRDCLAQGQPWYTWLITAQRLHCSRSTMIYRADDSTETALSYIWYIQCFRWFTCCSSCHTGYLSPAFDTIDQSQLLSLLNAEFGVHNKALSWLETYLEARTQRVKIYDAISEPITLTCGVPQGSVLGPILFTIYTMPMQRIVRKHGVVYHKYADDTQLYVTYNPNVLGDIQSAVKQLEDCIAEIRGWMINRMLKLNDNKTEMVIYMSQYHLNKHGRFDMSIGNSTISPVECVSKLGVKIDQHLTMDKQVTAVCKACNFHIYRLFSIRRYITTDAARSVVQPLVTSRLDYCNSLLANLTNTHMKRL